MKWFKHYTNASHSEKLNLLMEKLGKKGLADYWLLVELCISNWDGDNGEVFHFTPKALANFLRTTPKGLARFTQTSAELQLFHVEDLGDVIKIEFPKLAKYYHKDAKSSAKRQASGGPVAGKIRGDEIRGDVGTKNPPVSSAKKQEIRMQYHAQLEELIREIGTMFPGQVVPNFVKSNIEEIFLNCDLNLDSAKEVLNNLYQNPKINGTESSEGNRSAYISKSILGAFGVGAVS